jgi:uncharacterized protein
VGKVVFWIVIIFAVLLCLRLYNLAQQKRRSGKSGAKEAPKAPEAMVRCARCGVYLPRSEARLIAGAIHCRDKDCA